MEIHFQNLWMRCRHHCQMKRRRNFQRKRRNKSDLISMTLRCWKRKRSYGTEDCERLFWTSTSSQYLLQQAVLEFLLQGSWSSTAGYCYLSAAQGIREDSWFWERRQPYFLIETAIQAPPHVPPSKRFGR